MTLVTAILLMSVALELRGQGRAGSGTSQRPFYPTTVEGVLAGLRGGPQGRSNAVTGVQVSPILQADERVRAALIAELQRVNELSLELYVRRERGEQLQPNAGPGEYRLELIQTVTVLRDPRAIPALVDAVDTGSTPRIALAGFGDQAIPAVLGKWQAPDPPSEGKRLMLRTGLLRTLATMAELGRLSGSNRTAVLSVAHEAIERPQGEVILQGAIALAVALGDPALVAQVEAMARDLDEIYRRGVQTQRSAERVQRRARVVLGLP